jgi:hypothetical protein
MKTVADKEDSFIPILFLFICSVILGQELSMLFENLQKVGSVILSRSVAPILFADNALTTITNVINLLIPVALFFFALKQNSVLLKVTYIICTIPLILSDSVIIKIGYGNLFIVRIVVLFIVALLLINYLLGATESYKTKLKTTNNKVNTVDR